MAPTLSQQITTRATRMLTRANRGQAAWHCPVCQDPVREQPPTAHVHNCLELRNDALEALDGEL